jgi:hypothetical protein
MRRRDRSCLPFNDALADAAANRIRPFFASPAAKDTMLGRGRHLARPQSQVIPFRETDG